MQQNKHNEQHSSNHEKLRNLGKCQGKPQCGEPKEREREREREIDYLMLQESTLQQHTHNFQPRKKIPHNNKSVTQNLCLEKHAQIRTVVCPLQILCLEIHA